MNISFENVDKVSALLTVTLEKADYEEDVNKALKDFRKKASLPGFRPGMAPIGLLKKRFGEEITAEQVQKKLGEVLYGYIRENKVNILGEPMPNTEKTPAIDFNTMETLTFVFDVALAPEFDAKLTAKDKVTYYTIKVDDAMVDQQLQAYAQRAGQHNKVESYEAGDIVKGILAQLDTDGSVLEGGIQVEEAVMLPTTMKDESEKAKFNGSKVNDVLVVNPAKAYNDSAVELASLLHISKEEAEGMKADFSFQITEMTRFEPAKMDQDLFDKVLGEGTVGSEEEFRRFVRDDMAKTFVADSDYKFMLDLRRYLTDRIGEVEFPEKLLKRIMQANNPDKDQAFIDENYTAERG
ncbi:MAG: trigger factor, partial [Bacteroidaceae bacterium]|nr:trigger factor [Bacteroidaceae bacterium]